MGREKDLQRSFRFFCFLDLVLFVRILASAGVTCSVVLNDSENLPDMPMQRLSASVETTITPDGPSTSLEELRTRAAA
jgi:hypothetical protein